MNEFQNSIPDADLMALNAANVSAQLKAKEELAARADALPPPPKVTTSADLMALIAANVNAQLKAKEKS
jgi:hypothetical protein